MQLPALPSNLSHADAQACVERVVSALQGVKSGAEVEIDASALEQFDSSAIAVLLAIRRGVVSMGAELRVHALPTRLRELSALYGVSELLPG